MATNTREMSAMAVSGRSVHAAGCAFSGVKADMTLFRLELFWNAGGTAVFNLFLLAPLDGGRIAVGLLPDFHLH